MNISIIFRVLLFAVAAIGAFGGGSLSISHFHSGAACPMLGPLPACYLVFVSYALVLVSTLLPDNLFKVIFYTGWAPIFALAFIGALLHTFVGDTCPVDENGLPQCYLSLGLAVLMFIFSAIARRDNLLRHKN